MSFTLSRPCRSPGCAALVPAGASAWCAQHRRATVALVRRADRARGSAHSRGYTYAWSQAARAFLGRYPVCAGVLIPNADWSIERAMAYHAHRERLRDLADITPRPDYSVEASGYDFYSWDLGRPATVVDHIVPHKGNLDLFWAEWNWQSLTKRAHDKKTGTEQAIPPTLDHGFHG